MSELMLPSSIGIKYLKVDPWIGMMASALQTIDRLQLKIIGEPSGYSATDKQS
jgi:hypothetical protein